MRMQSHYFLFVCTKDCAVGLLLQGMIRTARRSPGNKSVGINGTGSATPSKLQRANPASSGVITELPGFPVEPVVQC